MERVFIKAYRGRQVGERGDYPLHTWNGFFPKWRNVTEDPEAYEARLIREAQRTKRKTAA